MIADLHAHTTCSDGSLSPAQLITQASEAGVDIFSITDHDNVSAYQDNLFQQARQLGIRLIQGIELSTTWQGSGIHIVGLNIDHLSVPLQQGVQLQSDARITRAHEIATRLEKLGIENALQGAKQFSPDNFIGRPHFAQFLVASGQVANIQQAFKRYLGSGKPGDVKQHWADLEQVISWIKASGGTAVLAHPLKYKLTLTKLRRLLDEFIELGGEAMEVVSGAQQPNNTCTLADLCQRKGLLASTGSDFHTPGQSWAALGRQPGLPDNCQPVWENFS